MSRRRAARRRPPRPSAARTARPRRGIRADTRAAATRLNITPRESEVLAQLALGRTNRQIAEALFISEKTASVHVTNPLRKLGVTSRVEAAAIAQRTGLTDS